MDDKQKKALIFLGVLVALALLFWFKAQKPKPIVQVEPPPQQNPADWPNGIYPGGDNMWGGGSPFDSTININVGGPGMGWLSSQYMPAFGLVGMVGVRG